MLTHSTRMETQRRQEYPVYSLICQLNPTAIANVERYVNAESHSRANATASIDTYLFTFIRILFDLNHLLHSTPTIDQRLITLAERHFRWNRQ